MFIWYFNWAILSGKSCQKQGVWKIYKKVGCPYRGFSVVGSFKPLAHYGFELKVLSQLSRKWSKY